MAAHLNKVLNPENDSEYERFTKYHLIGEIEVYLNFEN